MLLPRLNGPDIILALLSALLGLKPYCECHPLEPEDVAAMEEISEKLNELEIQLAARKREDLGFTPEEELEVCNWILSMNLRHFYILREHLLSYVEHRLVLVEGAQMTMQEAIEFLTEVVESSAPAEAGWTVTWEDHVKPEDRTLSNAVVRNDASRAAEKWDNEQASLTWSETMHADNS